MTDAKKLSMKNKTDTGYRTNIWNRNQLLTKLLIVGMILIIIFISGCVNQQKKHPQLTEQTVLEWKGKVSEVGIVSVVNFLLNNKGKEIELNGKHIITGKEKLDIKIKMLECCTKSEFEDVMELISKKGEVKSSNFNKREIHASVPADEIPKIDDIWNVAIIEFESEARTFWMGVIR